MSAPQTVFVCDSPGCRSYCQLQPTDAKTPAHALKLRGWVTTEDDPPRHYCQAHKHLAIVSREEKTDVATDKK